MEAWQRERLKEEYESYKINTHINNTIEKLNYFVMNDSGSGRNQK